MTGTVGVVAVTAGPGLTNTVTAIKNAQMAESPILLLGWLTNLLVFFCQLIILIVFQNSRWSGGNNIERPRCTSRY